GRPGMKRSALVVVLAVGCAAGLACRKPELPDAEAAAPWFADVTEAVGLDFVHDAGPVDGRFFLPQIMGSGAALFDCDGDGLLDLYLLQGGGPGGQKSKLYRQLPGKRFRDVSAGSGLDLDGYNMGVAIGDFDNDGRPDVLVTRYRGIKLFRNQGDGTFQDVTREA